MVVKKVLVGTKHWPLNTDVKKVEANKNAPDSKDLDSDSDSDSSEPEDTPAGSQRGKNARTNLSKQAQNQKLSNHLQSLEGSQMRQFFLCMAITTVGDARLNLETGKFELTTDVTVGDSAAFLDATKFIDYNFQERDAEAITMKICGDEMEYKLI